MTRPKQGGRVKTLSREGGKVSPGKVDESNFVNWVKGCWERMKLMKLICVRVDRLQRCVEDERSKLLGFGAKYEEEEKLDLQNYFLGGQSDEEGEVRQLIKCS